MRSFALPLVALAGLAASAFGATDVACSGPNARTVPPAGALVVDTTGKYSGSFPTVSQAVAKVVNDTAEHTIFVLPGVYHEQVFVPPLNGPLVLQGYTCNTLSYADNQVTITQAKANKDIPPEITDERNYLATTLGLRGRNIKVYNFNIANTAGNIQQGGQAVAVYLNDTNYGFYGCNMTGYQDTLCAHRGHELYARSYIAGAVDFIFGLEAKAWFESCDLESVGKGYITANGNGNSSNLSEYIFNRARVFGSSGTGSTYLGRPWRPYSRVVFQNSEISDVVNPKGWATWDSTSSTANIFFKEFNNSGPGAATAQRAPFSGQLSAPYPITQTLGENYASEWWVDTKFL
ncbi:Pectin methylesterase [Phytophthora cinnamomi]|uniref:Pectin methylesterase n=1 Tax=Phytophthora cinnamomi TaxID=4785 RepID=UPI00355A2845|nr:Pectin methylesterase [Phytophthora cinnamomi]